MGEDERVNAASGQTVTKLVTADGTYATQLAFSQGGGEAGGKKVKGEERPPLRKYLMEGDFFIGAAIGSTLTKLALRWDGVVKDEMKQNRFTAECMLVISSILHLNTECREALGQMLEAQVQVEGTNTGMEKKVVSIQ